MMQRFFTVAALLVLVVSLAGCMPKRGNGGGTSGDSLSMQVARHEEQLQRLLSQVGQVEQVLPGQAEMWSQMQSMRQELNSLHGKIDDLQNGMSGAGAGEMAQLNERVTRMESLMRRVASQLAIDASSLNAPLSSTGQPYTQTHTETAPPPPPPPSTSGGAPVSHNTGGGVTVVTDPRGGAPVITDNNTQPDTAARLYDSGIKAFDQGRYKDAIVSFKDLTTHYPKNQLASNSFFWQGECYYQLKDYARAALAYQEVIANYPASSKRQSAMLKQGISLFNAGKRDAGKERLQELVSKYPNSPEATRAKQFLQSSK